MSESRDHKCPRCGSYLPTVTVRVPVYATRKGHEQALPIQELTGYEDREEVSECVRCTGAY